MKQIPSCEECGESKTILNQVSNFNEIKYLCSECFKNNNHISKENVKFDDICEECKKEYSNVKTNLIMYGFKICDSCKISKTIFPI